MICLRLSLTSKWVESHRIYYFSAGYLKKTNQSQKLVLSAARQRIPLGTRTCSLFESLSMTLTESSPAHDLSLGIFKFLVGEYQYKLHT